MLVLSTLECQQTHSTVLTPADASSIGYVSTPGILRMLGVRTHRGYLLNTLIHREGDNHAGEIIHLTPTKTRPLLSTQGLPPPDEQERDNPEPPGGGFIMLMGLFVPSSREHTPPSQTRVLLSMMNMREGLWLTVLGLTILSERRGG